MPIFMVPKKDNGIRIISDFREVNMLIKRKPYHMTMLHGIMQTRNGYVRSTKMDCWSMQFYALNWMMKARNIPLS